MGETGNNAKRPEKITRHRRGKLPIKTHQNDLSTDEGNKAIPKYVDI